MLQTVQSTSSYVVNEVGSAIQGLVGGITQHLEAVMNRNTGSGPLRPQREKERTEKDFRNWGMCSGVMLFCRYCNLVFRLLRTFAFRAEQSDSNPASAFTSLRLTAIFFFKETQKIY